MNDYQRERYFQDLQLNITDKIILLDIDGTIVADSELQFFDEVKKRIDLLNKRNKIFLCSNSNNSNRNLNIANKLGVAVLITAYRKPSAKIIEDIPIEKNSRFVVIGDKLLTDALFARNIGADFILVRRTLSGKESLKIRLYNFIDDIVYSCLKSFGLLSNK